VNYGIAVAPGMTLKPFLQFISHPDQATTTPNGDDTHAIFVGALFEVDLAHLLGLPTLGHWRDCANAPRRGANGEGGLGLHRRHEREIEMRVLKIVSSPRKEKSASAAIVDAFLSEYKRGARNVSIDTLDTWQECLPKFDVEATNAKYKGVSGEPLTPAEAAAREKIRELSSRFQRGRPNRSGSTHVEFLCSL
jgi:hypothetical protein